MYWQITRLLAVCGKQQSVYFAAKTLPSSETQGQLVGRGKRENAGRK